MPSQNKKNVQRGICRQDQIADSRVELPVQKETKKLSTKRFRRDSKTGESLAEWQFKNLGQNLGRPATRQKRQILVRIFPVKTSKQMLKKSLATRQKRQILTRHFPAKTSKQMLRKGPATRSVNNSSRPTSNRAKLQKIQKNSFSFLLLHSPTHKYVNEETFGSSVVPFRGRRKVWKSGCACSN